MKLDELTVMHYYTLLISSDLKILMGAIIFVQILVFCSFVYLFTCLFVFFLFSVGWAMWRWSGVIRRF